jgi:glycosyltransferase involved in cell wall biosynthesis
MPAEPDARCFVSVIICTHDRAKLLRRALRSLARQTLAPDQFEVIVVDDGSQDDTAQVCDALRSELANLRYVTTGANIGLAAARNVGVAAAGGDYILFTDDDCIAQSDWVERMRARLGKEAIVAGAVGTPSRPYLKLCHNVAQFYGFMPCHEPGPKRFIAGANMGFRRSILDELPGFDQSLRYGEDIALILQAQGRGYRPCFAPDAIVTHDPERTHLRAILKYAADHASCSILLRDQYRALLGTPFVLRSATLLFAAAPVIALKVTAGIYLSSPALARLWLTAPVVYALKVAWCWGAARGLRNRGLTVEGR